MKPLIHRGSVVAVVVMWGIALATILQTMLQAQPTAVGPVGAVTTPTIMFEWQDTGAAGYDFQVSRSGVFDDETFETFTATSVTKCFSNLSPGQTVYWRVRETGLTWSPVFTVGMGPSTLKAPMMLTPADKALVPAAKPVVVSFSAVEGANTYNIEATTVISGGAPDFNQASYFECNAATNTLFTFTPFPDKTTVYWRVRGHDGRTYGAWSEAQSFTASVSATSPPVLSSFAPASGNIGATVTISGQELSGATVFFGNVMATIVSNTATQIVVRVPTGAVTAAIRVVTAGGSVTSSTSFVVTVVATPPTVSAFSPQTGPVGTLVTVSGVNFVADSTRVFFNGVQANSVLVMNASQLVVNVPSGASTGPITVITRSGSGTSSGSFIVTTTAPLRPLVGTVMGIAQGGATFSGSQLLLRERVASFTTVQSSAQSGTILVGAPRENLTRPVSVGFILNYSDSLQRPLSFSNASTITPLPTPLPAGARSEQAFPASVNTSINSLQGDLAPQIVNGNVITPLSGPSTTATISPDAPYISVRFTGRWSDQTFVPRSSGVQGARTVRLSILQSSDYDTSPIAGIATIQLNDPLNSVPTVINSIQDIAGPPGFTETIELENPSFRPDGKPLALFYDDNYDPLTYSISSSNPAVATATLNQRDSSRQFRPTFSYRVASGATPESQTLFTLTARDGRGGIATIQFRYIVRVQLPLISFFTPTMGPVGTVVGIVGAYFDRIQNVSFGGVAAPLSSIRVDGGVQITVPVPDGAKTGPISVTNLSGVASSTTPFTVTPTTSVQNVRVLNESLRVLPHPVSNESSVEYFVPERGQTEVELFDAVGQRVQTLTNVPHEAGEHRVRLNANNLSAGVYSLRVRGAAFVAQQMVVVTK